MKFEEWLEKYQIYDMVFRTNIHQKFAVIDQRII